MDYIFLVMVGFLAFGNGANDNFKGFATVWGSGTLSYRYALGLATIATVAGGFASLLLADGLVKQFSGRGLVSDAIASAPWFIQSVAAGASITILIATRAGLPVSTTHALIGGLVGAGFAAESGAVHLSRLGTAFFLPLLVSPMLAAALGLLAYRALSSRKPKKDCLCLVELPAQKLATGTNAGCAPLQIKHTLILGDQRECDSVKASVASLKLGDSGHLVHVTSATLICFARGVNDTPKLAALLLAAGVAGVQESVFLIVLAMAAGGLLYARRVAETMSQRLSHMDNTQGITANLITAAMVLLASKFSLPVSTTHVSVGAIAEVGASAATLDRKMLRNILLSWVVTLPLAALIAFVVAQTA